MKEKQKKIYYVTGDSISSLRNSPYLEAFKKHNIEVLLMHDRIDEWMMGYLTEFDGKQFQDIAKGELDLDEITDSSGEEKKTAKKKDSKSDEKVISKIGDILDNRVSGVRTTSSLTHSATCVVVGEHDMGEQMRKIMEAAGQSVPETKPTLEINVKHPLVKKIKGSDENKEVKMLTQLLFDQALLSAGRPLDDPANFVKGINKLMFSL